MSKEMDGYIKSLIGQTHVFVIMNYCNAIAVCLANEVIEAMNEGCLAFEDTQKVAHDTIKERLKEHDYSYITLVCPYIAKKTKDIIIQKLNNDKAR